MGKTTSGGDLETRTAGEAGLLKSILIRETASAEPLGKTAWYL